MGECRPTPPGFASVGPNVNRTIVDVINYGFGNMYIQFTGPLDLVDEYYGVGTCLEVLRNGVWESPGEAFWWPETPDTLGIWYPDNIERVGLPWRLKAPATGWTVGGLPLLPTSGIVVGESEGLRKSAPPLRKSVLDRKVNTM